MPHTIAHEIFMMQRVGLANPRSLLSKFNDEDRQWAERAINTKGPNKSKWLKLPMALLSQLVFKVNPFLFLIYANYVLFKSILY